MLGGKEARQGRKLWQTHRLHPLQFWHQGSTPCINARNGSDRFSLPQGYILIAASDQVPAEVKGWQMRRYWDIRLGLDSFVLWVQLLSNGAGLHQPMDERRTWGHFEHSTLWFYTRLASLSGHLG